MSIYWLDGRLQRTRLFGGYMQFSVRPYNLKEGQERTGDVGVRAPNEHSLYFGKFRGQFMHRDLAVPPSRCDDTLGQQCDPDARGHTAQNRFDRTEFQGLRNEYSSPVQDIVQPCSIRATNTKDDGFQFGYRGKIFN